MKNFKQFLENDSMKENMKDILVHPKIELTQKVKDLEAFLKKYKNIIDDKLYQSSVNSLENLISFMEKVPKHELYAVESIQENILNSLFDMLKSQFSNFIKQQGKSSFVLPLESKELFEIVKDSLLKKNSEIENDIQTKIKGNSLEIIKA